MKGLIDKLTGFLKETRAELKKVVWPDRKYVIVATIIIVILVIITGLYLMFVDFSFSKIFGLLLK